MELFHSSGCIPINITTNSNATKLKINFSVGAIAGGVVGLVAHPIDRLRFLYSRVKFRTAYIQGMAPTNFELLLQKIKSEGIRIVFINILGQCLTLTIYRGLYFGLYDALKTMELLKKSDLGLFVLGWSTSTCSLLAVFPLMKACNEINYAINPKENRIFR